MATAITPNVARKKILEARAGIKALPPIEGFAFGSGGVDSNGVTLIPTADMTELKREVYRKKCTGYTVKSDTLIRYFCDIDEGEMNGEKVSEIALYDTEGDLVNIQFFQPHADDLARTYEVDDDYST